MICENINKEHVQKAVCALKTYATKMANQEKQNIHEKKTFKKLSLMDFEDEEDKYLQLAGFSKNEELFLFINLKKIPPNITPFRHIIRRIPHPYHIIKNSSICLIVKDLHPKNPLADRELDLKLTRDHYKAKLLQAGYEENFINYHFYILPMRELITEYFLPEHRKNLVKSYDLFLADRRLMESKFNRLPMLLGTTFFIERKKMPFIVELRARNLKKEIDKALDSVAIYITGRGLDTNAKFGILSQSTNHLVDNLMWLIEKIDSLMGINIEILKIGSAKSIQIPIYANFKISKSPDIFSVIRKKYEKEIIEDEFDLISDNKRIRIYPDSRVVIVRKDQKERRFRPRKVLIKKKRAVFPEFLYKYQNLKNRRSIRHMRKKTLHGSKNCEKLKK